MNKTTLLIAVALVATAFVAAAPTASAEPTIADCGVFWTLEGHDPVHCVEDCTPVGGNSPLACEHDEE
jgi:hypothetical protein